MLSSGLLNPGLAHAELPNGDFGQDSNAQTYRFSAQLAVTSTEEHGYLSPPTEILFVDSAVTDSHVLINALQRDVDVVLLPDDNGVQFISKFLLNRTDVTAIHIVSHGAPGDIRLGNATLNSNTLPQYEHTLSTISESLSDEADILLYGCDVSRGEAGENFIARLSEITKADVRASDDATGAVEKNGDWDLEFSQGDVTTASIFDRRLLSHYSGVLAQGVATISGLEKEDEILSASVSDADGTSTSTFSYQWQSGGSNVGSNSATYQLQQSDVGNTITVTISYTDDALNIENISSAPTGTIANVNDAPTGSVTINGIAEERQTLTALDSSIADEDGLGTFSYQWKSSGSNVGGNSNTYQLQQSDVGNTITVTVNYTDLFGQPESLTSAATGTVANVNNPPSGSVIINGNPTQGQNLTATNTIADTDGLGTLQYQWKRGGTNVGSNNSSYFLTQPDVGSTITVVVSYTDGGGELESVTSTATSVIANINDNPTGSVNINGTPEQGKTLTASNNIADIDGLGTLHYQWKSSGSNVGSDSSSYLLKQSDVGNTITVVVSYTDGEGTLETVISPATAAVSNVNDSPTGSVTISGTASQDEVLIAVTSSINDADGIVGGFNYQWLRNNADISGAVASTYTLKQVDVGARIKVRVSYQDGGGKTESLTSAQTSTVQDVNDPPVGVPTISGNPTQGQLLITDTSSISDADGLGSFSYRWKRNGNNISGATSSQYTLKQADVNNFISVTVRYTDGGNTKESITSAQTAAVANVNDPPVGVPVISGITEEDAVLTANTSGISDADGIGSFNYQWKRGNTNINGAVANTYTLTQADVGSRIAIVVSYVDGFNQSESTTSALTAVISNVNDPPVGQPTISGLSTQNQILTVSAAGISDADGLGTFSFQWLRNGAVINAATETTYLLVQADVGKQVSVRVSYVDGGGKTESVSSVSTAAITNVNDLPSGVPTISGDTTQGSKLTADTSGISDIDGLGTFNFQWLRNGSQIVGATSNKYLLTQADVGGRLSVVVSYQDDGLTQETLSSVQTLVIADKNDPPTGKPVILGSVSQGGTITADVSGINDLDGLGVFSYQWLRNNSVISGAVASQYTLNQADVNKRLRVRVSYIDGGGTSETVASDQTDKVTNTNDAPVGVPVISGNATQGVLLTAVTTDISDADGLGDFNYQWLQNSNVIAGATDVDYRLQQADVGTFISVRVTYTDGGQTVESITSVAKGPVIDVNDPPVGKPAILGDKKQGSLLTADISGISDADGLGQFNYQWLRNNSVITGAISETYLLTQQDVGTRIRVSVSYTDDGLTTETVRSNQTSTIKNVNDLPTGLPVIIGNLTQGSILTVDVSSINDIDGLGEFDYQWLRNGEVITDAIAATYTLVEADVDTLISVRVSYIDGGNEEEELTSVQTTAIINVNDLPVGLPVILGEPVEQNTELTVDTAGISDEDGFGEEGFTYQWNRSGLPILGANASSYILLQDDVGQVISVTVSYTDGHGTVESVASADSVVVVNVNDPPEGVPVITGNLVPEEFRQGDVLSVDVSTITDLDGLGELSYQWLRDGADITDAISGSYTLVQADVGTLISVRVSYVDGFFTEEFVLSNEVGPVININDKGSVTIIGEATLASDFPLTVGEIIDIDGTSTSNFIYQWLRADRDAAGLCININLIEIAGETTDTYQLRALPEPGPDLQKCIALRVSYTDDFGNDEVVISNIKGPIFPDVPKVTPPPAIGPIPATGWFTFVELEQQNKATAKDGLDGMITPVADSNGQFRPGNNVVTWSATDTAGNTGTATQSIKIIPMAELNKFQTVAEGSSAELRIILNGDALQYPVTVPFTVSNSDLGTGSANAADHTLVSSQAMILEPAPGELPRAVVIYDVIDDGLGEGTENLIVTLSQTPTNAVPGSNVRQTIAIQEGNVAPQVNLEANQLQLDSSSGTVNIFAIASDVNDDDVLSYDWSGSDNIFNGSAPTDGLFSFDAAELTPGIYTVAIRVSDGELTATDTLMLRVTEVLPELSETHDSDGDGIPDVVDGYGDSDGDGVADYLDAIEADQILQVIPGKSDGFLIQTETGLKLLLGDIAFKANHGGSLLMEEDVTNPAVGNSVADTIRNVGGYFDFTVSDLAIKGQLVQIVLPQISAMPRVPVYRKLTASGWRDFVKDDNNQVSSALGEQGYCPPPGDEAYQPGLEQGHWCLQLTIEDGGPNDSDQKRDQRITDPGGVGRILSNVKVSSSGGGGGGSMNVFALLLTLIFILAGRNCGSFEIKKLIMHSRRLH